MSAYVTAGIIGLPEPIFNVAVGSQMVLFSADSETVSVNRLKNSVSARKLVLEMMNLCVGQWTFICRA